MKQIDMGFYMQETWLLHYVIVLLQSNFDWIMTIKIWLTN